MNPFPALTAPFSLISLLNLFISLIYGTATSGADVLLLSGFLPIISVLYSNDLLVFVLLLFILLLSVLFSFTSLFISYL